MRKWSVDEFEGLVRHQLTDSKGPVELVEGHIVPLPHSEVLVQQVMSLQQQMQQALDRENIREFVVRSHAPISIDNHSKLKPSLALMSSPAIAKSHSANAQPNIHWVLEITDGTRDCQQRQALYAKRAIADYWHLSTQTMELQIYGEPTEAGYRSKRLLMVNEQASVSAVPAIHLRLQEPLPLFFLTRMARGQRTYESAALPLQVC